MRSAGTGDEFARGSTLLDIFIRFGKMPLIDSAVSRAGRSVGRWCPATFRIRRFQPVAAVSENAVGEAARPASSEIQREYSTLNARLSSQKAGINGIFFVRRRKI